MLDLMRRKAQSPYIQATIVIIILVFIFWLPRLGQNGDQTVATVNGEKIGYKEFQRAYQQTVSRYREQLGGVLPAGLLKSLNIKQQVLNQLIEKILVQQGAREAGLMVSKEEVQDTIQKMQAFQQDGAFNMARYEQLLASSKISASDFEADVRSDLFMRKIMASLSGFARVSDRELRERFAHDYDEVKINYAVLRAKNFKKEVAVTDKDLKAFFDQHQDAYRTQPRVKLDYVAFLDAEVGKSLTVSDEEVKQYYERHQERYNIPEKRRARHILIKTSPTDTPEVLANKRRQLETILKMAKAGKDFSALAKEYSEDSSAAQGGDLGFFSRGQMVAPFENAAFALKEGDISDIVKTRFGLHIIKLEKIRPARTIPLADARKEIAAQLKKEHGKNLAFKRANEAYEGIILAGSLGKYASANHIALVKTGFFSRSAPPQAIAAEPAVLNAAFALKKGELSSLIETRDGYFILFVEDVKEPKVPALADVRKKVEGDFIEARAKELAKEAATALLAQIRQGKDFSAEAKKSKTTVHESKYFSSANRATSGNLPAAVVQAGLKLSTRSPFPATAEASGADFYVFRLANRKKAPQELFAQKRAELQEQLVQAKKLEIVNAWVAYLQSQAEITTNKQYLESS